MVVVEQAHVAAVLEFQRGNLGASRNSYRANTINKVCSEGTIQY